MTAPASAADCGDGWLRCVGCHGLVPDVTGPTHAYIQASPGCWAVYGQLVARAAGGGMSPATRWQHVDCYAVQHPGGAEHDRRQRQSVAVHLTALCLLLEHALPAGKVSGFRGRTSQTVLPALGLADWPYLAPSADLGQVTVADVPASDDADQLASRLREWAQAAWSAWSSHHETVRTWAAAALRKRR